MNQLLGYYRHHETNISRSKKVFEEMNHYTFQEFKNEPEFERAIHNMYFRQFCRYAKIDKLYSLKFIKYLKFKYLDIKILQQTLMFLFMPYKLIEKITKIV